MSHFLISLLFIRHENINKIVIFSFFLSSPNKNHTKNFFRCVYLSEKFFISFFAGDAQHLTDKKL